MGNLRRSSAETKHNHTQSLSDSADRTQRQKVVPLPPLNAAAHAQFGPTFFTASPLPRLQAKRTTGLQVIQRALPDANTYKTLDTTDNLLVAVGNAVEAYNNIEGQRGNPTEFQTCFEKLQAVDRAIYAWMNQVSAGNQRLDQHVHTNTVKDLMTRAEAEHVELIEQSKDIATVLPFDDTGLSVLEKGQIQNLWQDIVNNRGKIKVVGSADYNKRVRSELAKMLATPTGKKMLKFLATPKLGEVADTPEAELSNIYLGEKKTDLPQSVQQVSLEVEDATESIAQPLGPDPIKKTEIKAAEHKHKTKYPRIFSNQPGGIRDAAYGDRNTTKGFRLKSGERYDFNEGNVGALVTSFPGNPMNMAKVTGNEILSPGWVTLGHELGHAANMRAGATSVGFKAGFDNGLTEQLAGGNDAAKKWDNAEEFLNITNVENQLRQEAGITEREGHQIPQWLINQAMAEKTALKRPMVWMQQDGFAPFAGFGEVQQMIYTVAGWPAREMTKPGFPALKQNLENQVVQFFQAELVNGLDRLRGQDGAWALHSDWISLRAYCTNLTQVEVFDKTKMHSRVKAFLQNWTLDNRGVYTGNANFKRWKKGMEL